MNTKLTLFIALLAATPAMAQTTPHHRNGRLTAYHDNTPVRSASSTDTIHISGGSLNQKLHEQVFELDKQTQSYNTPAAPTPRYSNTMMGDFKMAPGRNFANDPYLVPREMMPFSSGVYGLGDSVESGFSDGPSFTPFLGNGVFYRLNGSGFGFW